MELSMIEDRSVKIKVISHKNKILTKNGFVAIIKGTHNGARLLRPDILEEHYIIPKGIEIS